MGFRLRSSRPVSVAVSSAPPWPRAPLGACFCSGIWHKALPASAVITVFKILIIANSNIAGMHKPQSNICWLCTGLKSRIDYNKLLSLLVIVLSTMLYQNCTTTPRSFQLSAWLPSTSISAPFVYGFTNASSSSSSGSVMPACVLCQLQRNGHHSKVAAHPYGCYGHHRQFCQTTKSGHGQEKLQC
jgi:hypothetical protein